jgi:basic amino acid/polyamine antiporter, APA family
MMFSTLLQKKKINSTSQTSLLRRALTASDLILMGIGAIIGAGVFVLTGVAAATEAGPAIVFSYLLAGMAALFAALAYAELASSIGGAGSAYHYAYVGFGEIIAWIIGWNLLLEYSMAVSTVAIGWSGYVNNLLNSLHIILPRAITQNPFAGGHIDLLAFSIVIALALLLCAGVKQSARFNAAIVMIKLFTIFIFIIAAIKHVDIHHWEPFLPFGFKGIIAGAALVFFAYIGFDALSTTVEETINPQRDIPIGIIVSLIICTLIYIVVSALLTLVAPYQTLNVQSPVAHALLQLGDNIAAGLIAAGAIAGLTTVILVMFYGFTRILLAMTRDGLLPYAFAKIHETTHTPVRIIIMSGVIMAFIAGFVPIDRAAQLVNIGTLAAFVFVCIGVIVLRITQPDLPRPFKTPLSPFIPALGAVVCFYLMLHLSLITWIRFFVWTGVGLIIYFFYSYQHSLLRQ